MLMSSPDLPHKRSLQVKQDDKFFSRLLSKEISSNGSAGSPSFRVYYGGVSGSVPFLWESQPGTPKHPCSVSSLPPLTPPPSYYSHKYSKQTSKKHPRSKLLNTLFFKINLKKFHMPPGSSTSSSPSFSSVSSWPSSHSPSKGRRRFSSERSSFDEEVEYNGSPNSTLCFGVGRDTSAAGIRSVCSVVMKKALIAMVGRGSA